MEEIATKQTKKQRMTGEGKAVFEENTNINPLRAEKVVVRFIPRKGGLHSDEPNHVASGGMMEGVSVSFCVPMVGDHYKNVLTNAEKEYLEEVLDLEKNALSVYKKENNFWDTYFVEVGKEGLALDLLNPNDYIKYKVLLANTDTIAPSLESLQDRPENTFRFVLIKENEEARMESDKMDTTMACYKEFGKIDSDRDTMRVLVELLDAHPYAENTPVEFFRSEINKLIQADSKVFLKAITDPMLHTKVIIRRATELGKLSKRGDYYYLRSDGSPLCDNGQDPTLSVAARWLNLSAHQDVKAMLEVAVSDARTA